MNPFRLAQLLALAFILPVQASECVVMLHGIARHAASLTRLENHLQNQGYRTLNLTYPSRQKTISEITMSLHPDIASFSESCTQVHFVTHSMGGLVARAYITRYHPANLGRVVMLAPPNQGSELADSLQQTLPYRWFFGPAGQELVTRQSPELLALLGNVTYPLGIIAGTSSVNWPASYWFLPGDDDGAVTVQRTHLTGSRAFMALPVNHTFMMNDLRVQANTSHFLSEGSFLNP